jgi:sterol desaturase/sphingolipid hydroxylase (fatty acid hydroxylase superfamily)
MFIIFTTACTADFGWRAIRSCVSHFRSARYDIHHHAVDDNGRMEANFGIGFFLFDRVFLTIGLRHRPFNRTGFEAARLRYGLIEQDGKLIPNNEDRISAKLSLRPR